MALNVSPRIIEKIPAIPPLGLAQNERPLTRRHIPKGLFTKPGSIAERNLAERLSHFV